MKKIHSLFLRDEANPRVLTRDVDPECQWVMDGEGTPTVKFDGTACAVINGRLYSRHFHKEEQGDPPQGWRHWTEEDPGVIATMTHGHGWLPVVPENPSQVWHRQAWEARSLEPIASRKDGTYELVGPKVQGNPYQLAAHELWKHGTVHLSPTYALSFGGLYEYLLFSTPLEGIVWHHEDGRMAKIKRRDFGLPWPVKT